MLPLDSISHRFVDDHVLPRWLAPPADEGRVTKVLETVARFDGLTGAGVDILAEDQLEGRVERALWALERKRWDVDVDAPVDPEVVRGVVFEHAATMSPAEAFAEAALALGHSPEVLRGALFADRASRRRWRAPERTSTAGDLIARYNLAVVQTLLVRAMTVDATVDGDPRAIVRAARGDGLLVRLKEEGGRMRLDVAGPLGLFHDTMKYGRSIARLAPSLVAAPSWSLRARVVIGGRSGMLALTPEDAVLPGGSLSAAATGPHARKLARALRAAGVHVDTQPEVLRADGGIVVVPDLALAWGSSRRVYVDVLPFATEPHLAAKLAVLARLDVPMILSVDERYVGAIRSPRVVPFKKTIDAWTLLSAAKAIAS